MHMGWITPESSLIILSDEEGMRKLNKYKPPQGKL